MITEALAAIITADPEAHCIFRPFTSRRAQLQAKDCWSAVTRGSHLDLSAVSIIWIVQVKVDIPAHACNHAQTGSSCSKLLGCTLKVCPFCKPGHNCSQSMGPGATFQSIWQASVEYDKGALCVGKGSRSSHGHGRPACKRAECILINMIPSVWTLLCSSSAQVFCMAYSSCMDTTIR